MLPAQHQQERHKKVVRCNGPGLMMFCRRFSLTVLAHTDRALGQDTNMQAVRVTAIVVHEQSRG